jgi:membrane fusion protein (multidrug efflux system)
MKSSIRLLVFSLLSGTVYSCGNKGSKQQQQAPPPTAVNVVVVQPSPAVYYDQYPGTVNALNQVDIHAQVSGYITGIYFNDGSYVNKGQKLYTIDQQKYTSDYSQAIANLNVERANLVKAQKNADRYLELDKNDAIAKQTVDNALSDLEAQKMVVEAAKANVSAVQTNVRYSTIYAPFSGVIGISHVKLGSAVAPGTTVLNTISAENTLAVDFAVDEKEIPRFVKIQQQRTKTADSIFTIALPDGSIYDYPGKIRLLDRAVDPQTGTILARLEFNNPHSILKPGMTCNVRVKTSRDSAIVIPSKAITEQMGEYFVFVIGDSNKAVQTKITIGRRLSDRTFINDGLKEGQKIITDGVQKVRDGAVVNPALDSTKNAQPAH